jgi:hypothetical protein
MRRMRRAALLMSVDRAQPALVPWAAKPGCQVHGFSEVPSAGGCAARRAVFDPDPQTVRHSLYCLPCGTAALRVAAQPAAQADVAEDDADRGALAAQPETAAPLSLCAGRRAIAVLAAMCAGRPTGGSRCKFSTSKKWPVTMTPGSWWAAVIPCAKAKISALGTKRSCCFGPAD